MALEFNYPDPVRDWRAGHGAPFAQRRDFYVPNLGKLEVKSVTRWNGSNRVNIPYSAANWELEKPNYIVVLSHIGGKWVLLCGAMNISQVEQYVDTKYHVKHSDSPYFTGPFLSIPLADFVISAKNLYDLLLNAKSLTENHTKQ